MKRISIIVMSCCLCCNGYSQSQEAQQLLLNVEKLAQLKKILNGMYKAYEIASKGYNTIKDISQGNFKLHEFFLDQLLQVSPKVRQYRKVGETISYQLKIVSEYKVSLDRCRHSNLFNEKELDYMVKVYGNLVSRSLQSLDELAMVITAGKLRMNDNERLAAIDRIHADMEDKLSFLRNFNKANSLLAIQRGREGVDTKVSKQLNGIQ